MSDGDRDSHLALLARDAGPVRRWLAGFFRRRVHDEEDVDDLVQDVFTRIVTRSSAEPVGHLGAYVVRTASSVLVDRARRRSANGSHFQVALDPDHHPRDEIDPDRILSGKEDLRCAVAALLSLPERTRTVFVLRRLEGFRHKEIAERLGISVSAVEKHMVRAIRHVSEQMDLGRDA